MGAQERWIWGERRRWKSGGDGRAMEMRSAEMGEQSRSENGGSRRIRSNGHNRKAQARARELGDFFFFIFIIFYIFYVLFLFLIEHGSQSGSIGNHAARHTLRILSLSLDSFRERALPSGMRRLRTRA